jgi:phospholipid-transporting ATPase
VIDGEALTIALKYHHDLFLDVSQRVASAVCCRLSPLQKAKVVEMFQAKTGATALGIGDGANDVSMIQAAKVGIGIVGLEGAQARLAADYAIPRFKHLKKLMMVHGRFALYRNSMCICFSFYKNILVSACQFCFSFFCGFSGQTLFDGWLLSFFNFAFTSIPPLFMGIFEKDLPDDRVMGNAKLFPPLREGEYLSYLSVASWFVEGIFHGVAIFALTYPQAEDSTMGADGVHPTEVTQHGTLVLTIIVAVVVLKVLIHLKTILLVQTFGIMISFIFYFGFLYIYSAIPMLFGKSEFYYSAYQLMGEPKFYLSIAFFVVTFLGVLDYPALHLQRTFFPTERDKEQKLADADREVDQVKKLVSRHFDNLRYDRLEARGDPMSWLGKRGDNSPPHSSGRGLSFHYKTE